MLFHSELDEKLFLLELGKDSAEPGDHINFLKKRNTFIKQLKDFRRQRGAKLGWGRHPSALIFALRRWHHSSYGRRTHAKLNHFLSTKMHKHNKFGEWKELKELLIWENLYYRPLVEQYFLDELLEAVNRLAS